MLSLGQGRRHFLQQSVALGALMLPSARPLLAAPAGRAPVGRARAVIVLLQEGGMSHFESWDPKPSAPAEIRGSFKAIRTSNPDLLVGEYMPQLARQAHLYNVVRSVYMDNARRDHSPGLHWVLTGHDNQAAGVALEKTNRQASVGSIVAHQRGALTAASLPNFVAIPSSKQLGGRVDYTGALHLGGSCEAFDSGPPPAQAAAAFKLPVGLTLPADVSPTRLKHRQKLLQAMDGLRRSTAQAAELHMHSEFQQHAFDVLVGKRGQEAFDINQEPPAIRARYGNSEMGQGTLLARRLVEAGVTYVLVNYSKNNSWDTHKQNFKRLKNRLLPPADQAAAALLTDLHERGMLDEVLVLMLGEMGRTPKINRNAGRDHWPDVFSLLIAGGGLTRGQVLGASTRMGDLPAERPVHYQEILATVYQQLGIDPQLVLHDRQNRPLRILPEADPVRELLG